jgi:hypothetical protein
VVACSNNSTSHLDAPLQKDAKVFMDAGKTFLDAKVFLDAGLPACTGLLYDPCNPAASNCMGAEFCQDFAGTSECTQNCSNANPCPDQNGTAVTCNMKGICKANAPNTNCTSP